MSRKISLVQFDGIPGTFLRIEYPDFNRVEYRRRLVRKVGSPVTSYHWLVAAAKHLASLFVDLLVQFMVG